ncbi:two-component sensor histidine kinase [Actinoplanes lobatus]|uniref:histidine kinase n=1 Tax=Actinoplanes lobatus TaxID=113568 RepID=A0A7W7MID5_9ACTN|nr:HAMP domain-containing sensor histidine kinase [Actinoplanes lobatus]MBB4750885.1 signal transduction histidine kinase [Actinoplanes lobatus]GGN92199.1 two-component sensor histidine kinase [Actinoplanes lobatus]GIE44438.1 two-component sensor histidine kinase [Actinoplanes lobatus]
MQRVKELSLRARLLLVSLAGLVFGLSAGAVLLIAVLGYAQVRSVQSEAMATARGVAALVDQGALPNPIPVTPGVQVQVIDDDNRVLASSATADDLTPMLGAAELAHLRDGEGRQIPGYLIHDQGEARVVQLTAGPPTAPVRILVARSIDHVTQNLHILRITLLILFPLLAALLAAGLWRALGAALRPVDALRAGAEEITGGTRAGRLPVPDSRDEVHRLAVTLNDMLHRLDAARARQRAFVADAAHELRSPLTNIRTELEVAQHLPDDTDWPALTDDLLADVQRLSRLVDDLLLLARSDEGVPATRLEEIDLAQFVGEAALRYPDVEYRDPGTPLPTLAEPDALARVVTNLLDNAERHKREKVTVSVSAGGGHLLIVVTDDGPGIPEHDRERVFQRFTRLDDARARDAGGSGLGLAIVRELVRRHRGSVTLGDNHPGLRVEVRLPKA